MGWPWKERKKGGGKKGGEKEEKKRTFRSFPKSSGRFCNFWKNYGPHSKVRNSPTSMGQFTVFDLEPYIKSYGHLGVFVTFRKFGTFR